MPQKKKTNPRRVPMTAKDVAKAWNMGADFGITFCLKVFCFVLKDKHDASDADLMQLRDEFCDVLEAYNRKDISLKDLDAVLEDDFRLHVELR